MNIIYISNTRIPSEKANTYQSMVMCEAFADNGCNIEFWYPKRNNTLEMNKVKNVFDFYGVNNIFELKELFSLDLNLLHKFNEKVWFLTQNISFALSYIKKIKSCDINNIIFSRDIVGLKFLSLAKKYGFIKQKVYFEAHLYSNKISKCCKYIDGLIVINNYLKELYVKDGIKNILVAHDGVKIDEYIGIKPKVKEKNIVYTGNLMHWKGVYTLADSMKYLDENVKLIIVGGSPDILPQFQKYIKDNDIENIELVGFVQKNETIKYIEKADVLILPNSAQDKMSYYTSPLKLFEYMASKRPIVASKLPSIEEVLKDKQNAILCEPDNPKDLADKIKWVLNNDCEKIVNQAYKDVQEYTWCKRVENILKWIKRNNV